MLIMGQTMEEILMSIDTGIPTGAEWNLTSNKCIGNEGSKTSFASISQAFSDDSYSFPNRQCNSLVLSCEDGGTRSNYLIELAKEIWKYLIHNGITITAEYLPSSMNMEADWPLRNSKDHSELKVLPQVFQRICQIKGKPEMDLSASRLSAQLPRYICMETRSIQSGNGCNAANLVQSVPLCFPTFFNDKQALKKDSPGSSKKNVDCSSRMAVSSMVPNPSENINREITSFVTPPTSSVKPPGSDTSINNKQNITISSLDGFWQRLLPYFKYKETRFFIKLKFVLVKVS